MREGALGPEDGGGWEAEDGKRAGRGQGQGRTERPGRTEEWEAAEDLGTPRPRG